MCMKGSGLRQNSPKARVLRPSAALAIMSSSNVLNALESSHRSMRERRPDAIAIATGSVGSDTASVSLTQYSRS